ncbi:MAG: signal peptidase II [Candidatus Muproteobacteria bacterium RBG_16_62_13]|uniref:Lipoprotein signal peptidase n=1 Tax=Candidatus Muproteobacteria bacterium RBG_16_62_13 TaxID=1817756 RepID=A0A1F6T9B6_9PROT|nr:MAG: signal peptidase II [Candidatus Muproteobacteria bacterium RBG_16_62_13]
MIRALVIALVVIVVDQLTKFAATVALAQGPIEVLPFLNFALVHNTGAAFGFLSTAGGWQKFFFIGIAALATAVIVVMLRKIPRQDWFMQLSLSLILGGALGNLVDRLIHGHVIDFIDFYVGTWHFWTFNVADAAISIGAVMLVMDAFNWRPGRPA